MTGLEEFESLKQSAGELGIEVGENHRYLSHNLVFRHQRFHFLEWGDPGNSPLVLLHGTNQSSHSWDLVSLHLSSRYHVFALDQRGHGDSEWSRSAHYTVADMMEDLKALIEALGLDRPVVIGHSMGGMVTLSLAHHAPELMRAAVVIDIGPEVNEKGTQMIREFVGKNVEFDNLEEFLDRVEVYDRYRTREHMARTVKYNLLRRADGRYLTKHDRRRFHNKDAEQPIKGAPSLNDLGKLPFPLLIVRGGDSNVLTDDAAQRFVTGVETARLVTVPDCGHNVASQNTVGFLGVVTPFLSEVAPA